MQQKLSHCRDEFSLLAGTFRLAVWVVIQASRLSHRTGILACSGRAGWEACATFPAGSRSYFVAKKSLRFARMTVCDGSACLVSTCG